MGASKRELFRAPEVCEMAQLQPYVLRTWEAEFPSLGQAMGSGPRVYRRADVEMVLRIKQLVFGEGLTLAGARRRLEEDEGEPLVATVSVDDVLGGMARARLREVRRGLEAIMRLLERDSHAGRNAPEWQLVAASAARAGRASTKHSEPSKRSTRTTVKGSSGKRRSVS
jgi:DNA-binding transcriptional MerR regulator